MQVRNVHERDYDASTEVVGSLIDSLASANDRLWPLEKWPPMRFDRALSLGARGGHGPIRYYVEHYVPSRSITFRFLAPRGFVGTHSFEVEDGDGRTLLRHVLDLEPCGWSRLSWRFVFRPLHDALLEDSLNKASASLGQPVQTAPRWSLYVRALRALLERVVVTALEGGPSIS